MREMFRQRMMQGGGGQGGFGGGNPFGGGNQGNLHAFHTDKIERIRCNWCHAAVPHGFKNKALLVNLNDVGPEAGSAASTEVPITGANQTYNQGPYYNNAKLKVRTFATSGNWEHTNCGSASGSGGSRTPGPGRTPGSSAIRCGSATGPHRRLGLQVSAMARFAASAF